MGGENGMKRNAKRGEGKWEERRVIGIYRRGRKGRMEIEGS